MTEFAEVKTAELEGVALDWAVAKAAGWVAAMIVTVRGVSATRYEIRSPSGLLLSPSSDWGQGGPLIEKYQVCTGWLGGKPIAFTRNHKYSDGVEIAPTLLIAACRAIVASKLGDIVFIPQELLP